MIEYILKKREGKKKGEKKSDLEHERGQEEDDLGTPLRPGHEAA